MTAPRSYRAASEATPIAATEQELSMDTVTEGPSRTGLHPYHRVGVAAAGLVGVAAFVGAAVLFPDPLAGTGSAAEAATALSGTQVQLASSLLAVYALAALTVVGALARTLGRSSDEPASTRLLPVLGAVHLLLSAVSLAGLAAAVALGTSVFDAITPTSVETGLMVGNVALPLAQWAGAGFLVCVLLGSYAANRLRWLGVIGAVFAVGMLVPPIGWAVVYLMPLWFAAAGIALARR